ncbi:MAG: hypothetical protein V1728_04630 [Candidatus Micrarchaeota archaeon]
MNTKEGGNALTTSDEGIFMDLSRIRFAFPLALGLGIGLCAGALKLIPGALFLAYLAMPVATLVGLLVLRAWREAAGEESLFPIMAYALLILVSFGLFGILYAPSGMNALPAALALSMLIPVVSEYALGRGRFKSEENFAQDESPEMA